MMTIRNRGKRNCGKCRAGTAGRDLLGHVQRGLDLLLRHHLRADALSVGGQEPRRVD